MAMSRGAWAGPPGGQPVTNIPEHHKLTPDCVITFTLYTMRSCSPSLRVVPSYLINFTKDKANIFSDLSLAVGGEEEKNHTRKTANSQMGDVDRLRLTVFIQTS